MGETVNHKDISTLVNHSRLNCKKNAEQYDGKEFSDILDLKSSDVDSGSRSLKRTNKNDDTPPLTN